MADSIHFGETMGIRFCPQCEKLLKKHKEEEKWVLKCELCGYRIDAPPPNVASPKRINKERLERKRVDTKSIIIDEVTRSRLFPAAGKIKFFRCGGHNIEFMQLQTRRADEGITTFFRCATCGNRWRMGS